MIDLNDSVNEINSFLESSETIGILVGQSDPENNPAQLHCGILHKHKKKIYAIHLAWHFCLKNDESTADFPKYFFVKSSLNESRQRAVAAMCRLIWKQKGLNSIPYGLLYSGGKFSGLGTLNLNIDESGFTCATFVLAVFNSCGITLIDIDNWETRESDTQWHNYIIECLNRTKNVSETHIQNVTNEIGCARFRPEEVAISSAFNKYPASFNEIIEEGLRLKEHISQ